MPPDLAQTLSRLSREDVAGFDRHERATSRQSKFDADVAAALVRILKDETRGVARCRAHEARILLKEIADA